jgi:branched-chain amino acid transport system substrate-binding protein
VNPEVLYFGGLTPLGVRIRAQMDKVGLGAQFQGTSGIVSDDFIKGLGPLAEGVVAFHDGTPAAKLPGGKYFLDNYAKQAYPQGAEAYGPYAYVAAMLIMDAIDKVGPDRKKVNAELSNVKDRETIVGKVTFDEKGQNVGPIITKYVVQDGKWLVWEDSEYATGKRKLRGR